MIGGSPDGTGGEPPGWWLDPGPRSLLFVPADRPELFAKAQASGADTVIVDLEDGVHGPADPDVVRDALAGLASTPDRRVPTLVRTNGPDTGSFLGDVEAARRAGLDGAVLAKCEDPRDVERAAEAARAASRSGAFVLLPLVETGRGVLAAAELAAAPGVVGLALGAEDLAVDLGLRRTRSGRELLTARSRLVLAVAAAGRHWVIDTPGLGLRDEATVRRETRLVSSLGFTGKLVVHPAQVRPVHEGFGPADLDLSRARAIVAAAAAASRAGRGVTSLEGRMIDRPVVLAAERLLRRAARATGTP